MAAGYGNSLMKRNHVLKRA